MNLYAIVPLLLKLRKHSLHFRIDLHCRKILRITDNIRISRLLTSLRIKTRLIEQRMSIVKNNHLRFFHDFLHSEIHQPYFSNFSPFRSFFLFCSQRFHLPLRDPVILRNPAAQNRGIDIMQTACPQNLFSAVIRITVQTAVAAGIVCADLDALDTAALLPLVPVLACLQCISADLPD